MDFEKIINCKNELLELMKELDYYEGTIRKYNFKISRLCNYLFKNNLDLNKENVKAYLSVTKFHSDYNKANSKSIIFNFLRFYEDGTMVYLKECKTFKLGPPYGEIINRYIDHLRNEVHYANSTIRDYQCILELFNTFFSNNPVPLSYDSINSLFIEINKTHKQNRIYSMASRLSRYFRYCYENGIYDIDYSKMVPKIKYIRNKELPSVFTTDEVKAIINEIDRNNPMGKRAYAMILLATRYGLRASDVVKLKFDNIDWDNSKINIIQYKTNVPLELPLLSDVGNAIIDYLKNGRRKSNSKYIFITGTGPIHNLSSSGFYHILNNYINESTLVNLHGRHHGPHSLRHSLATKLLESNIALPTISAVLGHSSTEVTKVYLSIDYSSLKDCSLDFPEINSKIYEEVN